MRLPGWIRDLHRPVLGLCIQVQLLDRRRRLWLRRVRPRPRWLSLCGFRSFVARGMAVLGARLPARCPDIAFTGCRCPGFARAAGSRLAEYHPRGGRAVPSRWMLMGR